MAKLARAARRSKSATLASLLLWLALCLDLLPHSSSAHRVPQGSLWLRVEVGVKVKDGRRGQVKAAGEVKHEHKAKEGQAVLRRGTASRSSSSSRS